MAYRFFLMVTALVFILQVHAQNDSLKPADWKLFPVKKKDSLSGYSPQRAVRNSPDTVPGRIEIIEDIRIRELVERQISINEKKGTIEGYRIQVFSASGPNSKTLAKEAQSEFLSKYSDLPAYLVFHSPNFKIRVGDFRTRLEAQKYFEEIGRDFPDAFIVKDEINLPKVD